MNKPGRPCRWPGLSLASPPQTWPPGGAFPILEPPGKNSFPQLWQPNRFGTCPSASSLSSTSRSCQSSSTAAAVGRRQNTALREDDSCYSGQERVCPPGMWRVYSRGPGIPPAAADAWPDPCRLELRQESDTHDEPTNPKTTMRIFEEGSATPKYKEPRPRISPWMWDSSGTRRIWISTSAKFIDNPAYILGFCIEGHSDMHKLHGCTWQFCWCEGVTHTGFFGYAHVARGPPSLS